MEITVFISFYTLKYCLSCIQPDRNASYKVKACKNHALVVLEIVLFYDSLAYSHYFWQTMHFINQWQWISDYHQWLLLCWFLLICWKLQQIPILENLGSQAFGNDYDCHKGQWNFETVPQHGWCDVKTVSIEISRFCADICSRIFTEYPQFTRPQPQNNRTNISLKTSMTLCTCSFHFPWLKTINWGEYASVHSIDRRSENSIEFGMKICTFFILNTFFIWRFCAQFS